LNEAAMSESHLAYLSLGSNIEPEVNLRAAVHRLSESGEVQTISGVWEFEPVGTTGPNYLNTCLVFKSGFSRLDLKENILRPIERQLGRHRSGDKFAPRPIDMDIIIFDGKLIDADMLSLAYVVVPLAEIHPGFHNPRTGETIRETSTRLRQTVWLEARPGVLG
jgi:2-amino-4-hydroxy-6-hydroxymethyldihydropteridine diphosphokinase